MSVLQKFLFDGLPVRGCLVRLTDAWIDLLQRRASGGQAQGYPVPVQNLLGEMVAAAVLMQSNIKFNGSLVLQVVGDGPVTLAVVEVQPDFSFRATATVLGAIAEKASLHDLVNAKKQGRCAITLDPKDRFPGQRPYQGVVPLVNERNENLDCLSAVLEHYMLQSEQLETTMVLAADEKVAAGLLIQRLPIEGVHNLEGGLTPHAGNDAALVTQEFERIAMLASSLKRDELLTLDAETILRRLFWQEQVSVFAPMPGQATPRFSCTCSRERVSRMIFGLGETEAKSIVEERGDIEVGCDFCGLQYRFDAVDVAQIFSGNGPQTAAGPTIQ